MLTEVHVIPKYLPMLLTKAVMSELAVCQAKIAALVKVTTAKDTDLCKCICQEQALRF